MRDIIDTNLHALCSLFHLTLHDASLLSHVSDRVEALEQWLPVAAAVVGGHALHGLRARVPAPEPRKDGHGHRAPRPHPFRTLRK